MSRVQADTYPLGSGLLTPVGADPQYYHRRLLQMSSRLFSSNEVMLEIVRISMESRGKIFQLQE